MLRSSCILHLYYWYKKKRNSRFLKEMMLRTCSYRNICCVFWGSLKVKLVLSVIYCFWSRGKESDNKLVFRATQRSNQCQITLYKYIVCVLWINCAWVVFWRFMKWGLWNFKECNDSVCVFVLVRTMYYIKNVLMQWCKGGRNDLVESDKYMIWLYFL